MKLSLLKASGIALLAAGLFSGQAFAAAAMANSKHDLSSSSTGGNKYSGTDQICVFCHTPHGSNTAAPVPLWNRSLSTSTFSVYSTLGTSTLDGYNAPVGGVSFACLSCHDGTIAINSLMNAPGSGTAGDATWAAGTWIGNLAATGKITGGPNLGADLRDDHPVGIQYGGGPKSGYSILATGAYPANQMKDAGFVDAVGDAGSWWVDTGGVGTREKTDMILFARDEAASAYVGSEPYVECATCHDPHTSASLFLRTTAAGSAICIACHVK